jgi:membrane fusion protein (multidrug efflux system)
VDLTRYEELAKAKNVSQQKVDEAKAELLVQEAAVRTAKADIEKAQLNVDYTEITAPIDGRIDVAAYTVGNLIGPDSGVLATINQMDPIKVAFSIAETWYLDIMKENLAHKRERGDDGKHEPSHVPRIKLADGTMYEHDGELDFIDNKVDEKTGTVLVRAVFDNPDGLLLPGQFITVVIERKVAVDAVVIPQAAVLTDQGGAYVLLVNDEDKVEARRIETGQRFGPSLVVTEGLKARDRIVMYGIQKVRPGILVRPEPVEAPGDPLAGETGQNAGEDEAGDESTGQGAAEAAE